MAQFIVVGGLNRDILGILENDPRSFTSNPCTVQTSYGGVAYNVARQLSSRRHHVKLVSLIGNDKDGEKALIDAINHGINTSLITRIEKASTSSYFGFLQQNKDMLIAFADMAIMKFMTPTLLSSLLESSGHVDALIIDANVPPESCAYLSDWARRNQIFLAGVAVCSQKMDNFRTIIKDFDCLIMNSNEAAFFSTSPSLKEALKNQGLKCIAITNGAYGVTIVRGDQSDHFSDDFQGQIVDTHGAGDAFSAGFISALVEKRPLDQAVSLAFSWAHLTLQHWGAQP